jgi:hypothetical protein
LLIIIRPGLLPPIFTHPQILGHRAAGLWDVDVFTPQRGREKAAAYLRAADKVFSGNNFRYVGDWFDTHSAVLEFTAELDGLTVEGVDMIQWNDEGKIVSVKVMIRPLKALQALVPKMGGLLLTS